MLELIPAQMEKFGMSSHLVVNALKQPSGMEKNANSFLSAQEAKLLIINLNANAQVVMYGQTIFVYFHHA